MNKKPNEPVIQDDPSGKNKCGDGPEPNKISGINRRTFLGAVATISGAAMVGSATRAHASADFAGWPNSFGLLTDLLVDAARESCPGRLAFVLEGGYNLRALSEGTASVLAALLRAAPAPPDRPVPSPGPIDSDAERTISDVLSTLAPFWKLP